MSAPTLADWQRVRPDLHRVGAEHHGSCPSCGGQDRFRVLDSGAAFCRQCTPTGDADGAGIKRLQTDAGLNGASANGAAAVPVRRLPLGGATKRTKHIIRDTAGKAVAVHVRIETLLGKNMPWCLPNGTGGLAGMKLPDLPLYRSEDVPRAAERAALVLVEGEKAADALRAAEPTLLVLGTVTGDQTIPAPEVLQTVVDTGLPIYLWPDADDGGATHMQRIGQVLHGAGAAPLVIAWNEAPPKGDAADWARFAAQDRVSWSTLATAAAPWSASTAPAPATATATEPKEKKTPPAGAYHAARAMEPDLSGRTMFVAGAWYWRSSDTALWQPDTSRVTLGKVQAHPERERCQRGLRSPAIMGELEGMLSVDGDLLDADLWTAGLPDGRVLNLRDGTARPAAPDDLITMKLGTVPDASGPPAVWLRFLGEALQYANDIDGCCRYLRWWIRSALTGDNSAHRMIFLHGQSGTGKNTLADLVKYLAGTYGRGIHPRHVVSKRGDHLQWLARLAGKRFALIGDMPAGGAWSSDLHDLVAGGTITANHMRQNSFDYLSRVHVMATGNDAPTGQAGIWRRLVQFELRHKPTPANKDTDLPAKLRAEAGRILAWALDGDTAEPTMPAELAGAAEAVRDEQNPVAAWIRESWRPDPLRRTPSAEMYAAYLRRFADVPDRDQVSETAFAKLLTAEFGPKVTPRPVIDGRKVSVRKCAEQ